MAARRNDAAPSRSGFGSKNSQGCRFTLDTRWCPRVDDESRGASRGHKYASCLPAIQESRGPGQGNIAARWRPNPGTIPAPEIAGGDGRRLPAIRSRQPKRLSALLHGSSPDESAEETGGEVGADPRVAP